MYHSLIVERAMQLRNQQTDEERKLWYVFLNKYPIKIRRQYPLNYYIADFFCREAGLIIEIDGIQHQTQENIEYDEKRTNYIESKNYKVIRFNNTDIKKRFDDVCFYIDLIIKERLKELGKEELIEKIEKTPIGTMCHFPQQNWGQILIRGTEDAPPEFEKLLGELSRSD